MWRNRRLLASVEVPNVRSIGFYCEDEEVERRQYAINQALECSYSDLSDMAYESRLGQDNVMMTFARNGKGEPTPFYNYVLETALDHQEKSSFSTLRQTFSQATKTTAIKSSNSYNRSTRLPLKSGSVVLCAHPSRAGLSSGEGDSGSTGWSNSVRSRLYLESQPRTRATTPIAASLERRKANYARRSDMIPIRWKGEAFTRRDSRPQAKG